jgi:hypothetical protein
MVDPAAHISSTHCILHLPQDSSINVDNIFVSVVPCLASQKAYCAIFELDLCPAYEQILLHL